MSGIPEDRTIAEHNKIPQPTKASEWKSSARNEWKSIPVPLPSGNTALMRRVGLEQFLLMGMIPNELVTLMQAQIRKAKGKTDEVNEEDVMSQVAEMMEDAEKLVEIIDMVDHITIFCVLEPHIEAVPTESGVDRDEGTLYVDMIDIEDKLFIFQWAVGGVEDLTPFREELAKSVGPVLSGAEVASEAQRTG